MKRFALRGLSSCTKGAPGFRVLFFIGVMAASISYSNAQASIPVANVDFSESELVTVTKWRICGPFKLPTQSYTPQATAEAFDHDYLTEINGTEVPLTLGPPTTNRPVDFAHDPNDEPNIGPPTVQFMDQVQQFPFILDTQVLFWSAGNFFKVTYAAVILESPRETDAAIVLSGNSPIAIWLNNERIVQSVPSSVGHDFEILHITTVHLRKGENSVLLKLFCFPKINKFVFRVATRERALAFVRDRGGIRDVVDEVILPPGQPLRLSDNLRFFATGDVQNIVAHITNVRDHSVMDATLNARSQLEIPTSGLSMGLYTIQASIGEWHFEEKFYLGPRDNLVAPYEKKCSGSEVSHSWLPDPCATFEPLKDIASDQQFAFRLDWQKRAFFLISELEWAFLHREHDAIPLKDQIGTHLRAYRSRVDGQVQPYLLHLPKNYNGHAVPLVVVLMPNFREIPRAPAPFLSEIHADEGNLIQEFSTFADEYGYAVLWPHIRVQGTETPIAVTDVLEALTDVQRRYAIDHSRIYLTGECRGATNALMLAQHFPDRFAAISLLNLDLLPRERETENGPLSCARNLLNVPLQLIHGTDYPHSPVVQSIMYKNQSTAFGITPELKLLPGHGFWGDDTPNRVHFEFFKGKVLQSKPSEIELSTAQLKYGSAYWIRIKRLGSSAVSVGTVRARFEEPNTIVATIDNIAELEILPNRLPVVAAKLKQLHIRVNGIEREVVVDRGKPIAWRISPAQKGTHIKNALLEGPVTDAFAEPFLVVEGSHGSASGLSVSRNLAEQIEAAWQQNYYVPCRRKLDREITADDIAKMNLVLVGGPEINSITRRIAPFLPFTLDAHSLSIDNQIFDGDQLFILAIYPNPMNRAHYVVIVNTNSASDVELPVVDIARDAFYDVAVWRAGATRSVAELVGEYVWDDSWKHLQK